MKFNKEKIVPADEFWPKGVYIIEREDGKEELILKEGRDDDVYQALTTMDFE